MAYQSPAFYYYHALRDATSITNNAAITGELDFLFDSRRGEIIQWTTGLDAGAKTITVQRENTAISDAVDHVILSGHNINGEDINIFADSGNLIDSFYTVTEANGDTIVIPFDSTDSDAEINLRIIASASTTDPIWSEVFFTTKHEMSRGPRPDFDTSWRRNQQRFVNDAGVSSTFLQGAARKTYTLTWEQLVGTDRQIILDMREQTSDFSNAFWFLPPDDSFPIVFVELDRDASFIQDFDNPQGGTSDRVTLSMIEVLG